MILRGTRSGYPVKLVGKVFCQKANSWTICGPTEERPATFVIFVERHWQVECLCGHTEEVTLGRNPLCAMFVAKLLVLLIIWIFTSIPTWVPSHILAKNVARVSHSVHHCQYTSATTQESGHTNVCCVARHLLQRRCWTLTSRTTTKCFRMLFSFLLLNISTIPASSFGVFHVNWKPKMYDSSNSVLVSHSFSRWCHVSYEYESGAFVVCEHFV
jgi:hypothetical protein